MHKGRHNQRWQWTRHTRRQWWWRMFIWFVRWNCRRKMYSHTWPFAIGPSAAPLHSSTVRRLDIKKKHVQCPCPMPTNSMIILPIGDSQSLFSILMCTTAHATHTTHGHTIEWRKMCNNCVTSPVYNGCTTATAKDGHIWRWHSIVYERRRCSTTHREWLYTTMCVIKFYSQPFILKMNGFEASKWSQSDLAHTHTHMGLQLGDQTSLRATRAGKICFCAHSYNRHCIPLRVESDIVEHYVHL